jgi:hypothetical protein
MLKDAATAAVGYGVVMIVAAWLAGPSRPAVSIRRVIAPYFGHPAIAYGTLTVIVALILWWAPTPATRKPLLALLLIALLAAGTEVLRRQVKREFPDAQRAETMRWVRGGLDRALGWGRTGTAAGRSAIADTASRVTDTASRVTAPRADAGSPADDRIEALERLARLRDAGALDAGEFAEQKRLILAEPAGEPAPDTAPATPA